MKRDARDYLIELYENGMLSDLVIQGLIVWMSSDEAEDFCRIYELGYNEEEDD